MIQNILFGDSPALFGIFGMCVYDIRNGQRVCVRRIQKRNQITNQGRVALLELMRPPAPEATTQEKHRIWSFSVGTHSTPPTINDDDTTMIQVWKSAFSGSECQIVTVPPNQYLLQIGKILPEAAAVGSVLVEAGVFTRGDDDDPDVATDRDLYARQTHPAITKSATMIIEYNWKLGISIQGA